MILRNPGSGYKTLETEASNNAETRVLRETGARLGDRGPRGNAFVRRRDLVAGPPPIQARLHHRRMDARLPSRAQGDEALRPCLGGDPHRRQDLHHGSEQGRTQEDEGPALPLPDSDRKSTRLNSSHEWISYAVFCLKKKKN